MKILQRKPKHKKTLYIFSKEQPTEFVKFEIGSESIYQSWLGGSITITDWLEANHIKYKVVFE